MLEALTQLLITLRQVLILAIILFPIVMVIYIYINRKMFIYTYKVYKDLRKSRRDN